jgi:hypothetical protein
MNAYALGGSTLLSGVLDASNGAFHIDGVPEGTYLLEFINAYGLHHFFETDAASVDLGWNTLGRPDVTTTSVATQTTFQLDGLEPTGTVDAIEMTSSNAGVLEVLANVGGVPVGVESFSASFDWSTRPTHLVDGTRGDTTFVHQLCSRTDAASGLPYNVAATWGQLPAGFAVTSGVAQTVEVAMAPAPQTGLLSTRFSPSLFEALVSEWPPGAQALEHYVNVDVRPSSLEGFPEPPDGSTDLLALEAPAGTANAELALSYGQFFPPLWKEYARFAMAGQLLFPWEGGSITYQARISSSVPMDALPAVAGPIVSPPRAVLVNGLDKSTDMSAVGTTPTISWSAPLTGTPNSYLVSVLQLVRNGNSLAFLFAADFVLHSTSVKVPPGLLKTGNQYVVYIAATVEPEADFASAPFRRSIPTAYAETASAPFAP